MQYVLRIDLGVACPFGEAARSGLDVGVRSPVDVDSPRSLKTAVGRPGMCVVRPPPLHGPGRARQCTDPKRTANAGVSPWLWPSAPRGEQSTPDTKSRDGHCAGSELRLLRGEGARDEGEGGNTVPLLLVPSACQPSGTHQSLALALLLR